MSPKKKGEFLWIGEKGRRRGYEERREGSGQVGGFAIPEIPKISGNLVQIGRIRENLTVPELDV